MDIHNTVKHKDRKDWSASMLTFYKTYTNTIEIKHDDQSPESLEE
jgi:hypothetical protein